ncbi:uncharacterized protein BCR38DRAFT_436045 [Pseudomassariella vexata]|uniref:CUE domain-containing protein n=1 Tax=Pseudomassariella vexata TaxID=1141098 RepID=A0A1Y2DX05_9PEZI|nr:uncharacterized protein BCR38DRAFT_436045 [Pseudomassariella vexata]ORY63155.1 hypothetical protein BCR38DRAFT_436045 [Pseudomassariella vexata]
MANEQISLPSVILIVVLSVVVLRYLFLSPARPSAQQQQQAQARDSAAAQRRRDAAVEQLQQMFPQVDRRTLLWDLQRTGGNMSATTERILSGRVETVTPGDLPTPSAPSPSPSLTSQSHVQKAPPSVTEPDLITRYNLQNKVSGASEDAADDKKAQGWSSNKDERQSLLQKRRNEMILQARRRMEAKIAAERAAGGS